MEGGTDQRRAAVGEWQLPICRSAPAEHPCPTRTDATRTDANAGTTTPHWTAATTQIGFEAETKKRPAPTFPVRVVLYVI